MRYGSVCSGIEAATVAWHALGWEAAWFSEIEPFPCAVLAHHYPDVPNHGDMTALPSRILAGEVEAPDLLCGGTPCQAFSVAGQRRSLDDARGNLSLTFCEVADAIDTVRQARGDDPAIIVWENVPGIFTVKDQAFGCFLAQLAGEDEAIAVEKWPRAGVVDGRRRRVAWAVLDAQFFGLAQRRRRVFVVAVAQETVRRLGDRADPAAILSIGTCMRRDSPSRSEPRQGAAYGTDAGAGSSGSDEDGHLEPAIVGALDTECGGNKLSHQSVRNGHLVGTLTARMMNALGPRDVEEGALVAHVTHTLTRSFGATEDGTGRGTPLVAINHPTTYEAKDGRPLDCSLTLDAGLADGPRRNQGGVIALDARAQSLTGDVSKTIASRDDMDTASLVAVPPTVYTLAIRGRGEDRNLEIRQDGTANALLTPNGGRDGIGVGAIAVATRPIAMRESGQGYWMQDDIAGTLRAEGENRPSRPSHVIGTPPLRAGAHAPTIAFHPIGSDPLYCEDGTAHAMTCGNRSGTASIAVAFPIISDADRANSSATTPSPDATGRVRLRDPGLGVGHDGDPMFTLTASKPHAVGTTSMQVEGFVSVDVYNGTITGDCAPTVTSASGPNKTGPSVMHAMAVRRLTPRECERLQGFPDDYTRIPLRGKPADQCPDGPRYKAIGNSWAVPVVRWIGERIADAIKARSFYQIEEQQ